MHRFLSVPMESHFKKNPKMSRTIAAQLLACILLSLIGQSPLLADQLQATVSTQVDSIVEKLIQKKGAPGVSIAVGVHNALVYANGYGLADLENNVRLTTETRFRTASIAKSLTAVLVLCLEERGAIDLDVPIRTYLPDFPEKQWPVTARQLLGHLAGIRHYKSSAESLSTEQFETVRKGLKVFADDPLSHQPGSEFLYSSFGYNLLGAVAEQAGTKEGGGSFIDLLRRYVLAPAAMGHTTVDSQAEIISSRSRGYVKRPIEDQAIESDEQSEDDYVILNAPLHNTSMKIPGGGLLSTPSDLVRFAVAVNTGRLLRPDSCQRMWTRQTKSDGDRTDYGLGWKISRHKGRKMVSHSGGQAGVSTLLVLFPDSGVSVALMCNLQNVDLTSTAKGIADLVLPEQRQRPDYTPILESLRSAIEQKTYQRIEDSVPEDIADPWRGLVGEYGPDERVVYILEELGKLTALLDRRYYYPLQPIDQDTFQFPEDGPYSGEVVRFHRDSKGRATEVVFAGSRLDRRLIEPEFGSTFKIRPIRLLEDLRAEAMAATPPEESRELRRSELQEVTTLDPTIQLDIRYATENNFMGAVFYNQPRAFLQLPAAQALVRVHQALKPLGLGLLIYDAYRPWFVTKMFWEATPKELSNFVANPARGSRHNRGCAVDLSLFDLKTGEPVSMVSDYDEFTPRAHALYPGGSSRQRYYRDLLRRFMEREGFLVYEDEWWHFDYHLWQEYQVQNVSFESISDASSQNAEVLFEYPTTANGTLSLADGFHGIWYMNQPSKDQYVYKYSGGMATYPWQHHPIAVYSPEAHKTFFVYGGRYKTRNKLLHCISYMDHATGLVARPRVLLDKKTDDAHDNPVLCIDDQGYLLVFSSAHGTSRPAYIHRSRRPYEIDEFDCVATTNFSYPQPWNLGDLGLVLLHTRYKGGRVLHAMNSWDGMNWSQPRMLAHIDEGHYQVSQVLGNRLATAFNFHPKGKGLNHRTNIYYMESSDGGQTWRNARGEQLTLPLTEVDNPALVADFASESQLCYMRCLRFTSQGQPVILFVTSGGYQSGPQNDPRRFMTARWTGTEWDIRQAMECDNNYDFADLEIREDGIWQISGATEVGPQAFNTGGEIALWHSRDEGASWQLARQLTTESTYNHNFPRKPVNAHRDFYLLWADGHARQPSDSCLYFTDRDGSAIWKLPSELAGEERMVRPLRFEVGEALR